MDFGIEFVCASIFTLLCILLAFAYRYICKWYTYFEKMGIPGPVSSMFIGSWKELPGKFVGDVDVENAKIYGTVFGTFDGLTPNLMVVEPEGIKDVLLTSADKFTDRRVSSAKNPILRKSLSSLYGEEDPKVEALTNSLVTSSKLEKLVPTLETTAINLVETLQQRIEDGRLNLTSAVRDYIYSVIASAVFGIELNADIEFRDEFVSHCDQILTIKNPNSKLSLIPYLYENLQGDSWILPEKSLAYFVNLIKTGIRDTPKNEESTENKALNLIVLLVEASEREKKLVKSEEEGGGLVLTEDLIISKCIASILALINSSKMIVLLTVYSLAGQQEYQDELSREIEKNKSEKMSFAESQLLDMVVAEVLRLYPTEFRLEKMCEESVTVGKVNLAKGDRVSIPLYALHRQEKFFAEPEKFDPRRFTQEEIEKRNPFTYFAFGQRGANTHDVSVILALLTAKLTVFKLFENFKFKEVEGHSKILFKRGITGMPKPNSLTVVVEPKN